MLEGLDCVSAQTGLANLFAFSVYNNANYSPKAPFKNPSMSS